MRAASAVNTSPGKPLHHQIDLVCLLLYIIIGHVKRRPVTVSKLSRTFGLSRATTARWLSELVASGYVERIGNDYWLTEKTNSPSVQNVVAKSAHPASSNSRCRNGCGDFRFRAGHAEKPRPDRSAGGRRVKNGANVRRAIERLAPGRACAAQRRSPAAGALFSQRCCAANFSAARNLAASRGSSALTEGGSHVPSDNKRDGSGCHSFYRGRCQCCHVLRQVHRRP